MSKLGGGPSVKFSEVIEEHDTPDIGTGSPQESQTEHASKSGAPRSTRLIPEVCGGSLTNASSHLKQCYCETGSYDIRVAILRGRGAQAAVAHVANVAPFGRVEHPNMEKPHRACIFTVWCSLVAGRGGGDVGQ